MLYGALNHCSVLLLLWPKLHICVRTENMNVNAVLLNMIVSDKLPLWFSILWTTSLEAGINISQGRVATHLRCCEISLIVTLLLSTIVKEFGENGQYLMMLWMTKNLLFIAPSCTGWPGAEPGIIVGREQLYNQNFMMSTLQMIILDLL